MFATKYLITFQIGGTRKGDLWPQSTRSVRPRRSAISPPTRPPQQRCSPQGDMWWKGFVRQIRGDAASTTDEPLFIMDHGVYEDGKNDALRFLTSTDLQHWTENSTSHPDPTWYRRSGRWDHMYMSADGR